MYTMNTDDEEEEEKLKVTQQNCCFDIKIIKLMFIF